MAAAFVTGAPVFAGVALGAGSRAYELVSPADKNGGDVMAYAVRTRAAADGNAVDFASLSGFGDVRGTGAAVEYLAQRSPTGWVTHAITPTVASGSIKALAGGADAFYDWEFSADLSHGIFSSGRSITDDPNTKDAGNLYLRTDLLSAGPGTYQQLTRCPLCDATGAPLPLPGPAPASAQFLSPAVAGASSDMGHVAFESWRNLTADAPAQSPLCGTGFPPDPPPWVLFCTPRLYEWDHGQVRLAGILPDGTAADASIAGTGVGVNATLAPHDVSDGSDGHSRIFFTWPTDDGSTTDAFSESGNLYMRVDHAQTVQLNASERSSADSFAPAQFLGASTNGERVFFMTTEALTDDAPADGAGKIYMYDATKPDTAPDNLTLLNRSASPPTPVSAVGMIGTSDDGHYAYLIAHGPLVVGVPRFEVHIFLWHDGEVKDVGPSPSGVPLIELQSDGVPYSQVLRQARVTPDGRHLLFTTDNSTGLGGYDQGTCTDAGSTSCREVYVYSADTGHVSCVSCNPSGAAATSSASVVADANHGGARVTSHQNRPIADDGSRVFFNSAEALVPEDTNGKIDAYEWRAQGVDGCDKPDGCLSLVSSGTDASDSWFLDAGADGRDVFFVTRERLVGWDTDSSYDLYDARIGGGFPEPPPASPPCTGGTCQGPLAGAPPPATLSSSAFHGAGNVRASLRRRSTRRRPTRACKRGFVKKKAHGKTRCVRKRARRRPTARRAS